MALDSAFPTTKRLASIQTALGAGLWLTRLSGREELGRLFEYQIDLLSQSGGLDPLKLLGTEVTVEIITDEDSAPRYINGCITQLQELGEASHSAFQSGVAYAYRIEVRPWLWFATRRTDCQIFPAATLPDIVKQVLAKYGGEIEDKLTGTHTVWEYCVQYRETDFNFVSRLMEQEGIYYYFKHQNGKHSMVLADASSAHAPIPISAVAFHQGGRRDVKDRDYLSAWTATTSVVPGGYTIQDYDLFKARTTEGVTAQPHAHPFGDLEVYDYPGEAVDVAAPGTSSTDRSSSYASLRLEELQSPYLMFEGAGNVRSIQTGWQFELTDHPQRAMNTQYLVVSSQIQVDVGSYASGHDSGAHFDLSLKAMRVADLFRPQRLTPKPMINGAQTAVVVGNGEIDCDSLGRIKVQFHWDRIGNGCWVRVAQTSAGKNWGAMFIPRVNQEVVVEFLEGDPDRPIVTGVVYNASSTPPYALPDNKTRSTLKTNSSPGGGGFNELRFEDKAGSEQIFIYGQKQLDLRVKENRLEYIGKDSHHNVQGNRFESVNQDTHVSILGDRNEAVSGTESLKTGQDLQIKVGGKSALDTAQEIYIKAGSNLIIEAGSMISLAVSGNFITIGPSGVVIQGTLTQINSGGSAGTGSGCSPTAPTAPLAADDGTAGEADSPPPAPQPPKAKTYSLTAVALQNAAQSGSPLCPL